MFAIGKSLKYLTWLSMGLFGYHFYLVKKSDKPEAAFLANEVFLNAAKNADYFLYDMNLLLTRPPVEKLLQDKPNMPGMVFPKTLVLNLRGTLIHSEYKVIFYLLYVYQFGQGFEILKRPGLSVFLQRMSRFYEVVIFGDEETGVKVKNS